ncbi:MAG: TonB-dependent receptor [Bacteroidetes bacterium]|nr:TonB-dependent receptor [Bacteroidota bacterium]MBS1740261.1 TonB-dependent receptor [Bacteroidota bacterium]
MPFKIHLWWVALLAPLHVFAQQNSIRGTITDTTGSPVVGAIISFPELKIGTTSDTGGHYVINRLPLGSYLIEVRSLNFVTHTEVIKLNGNVSKNFRLSESIIEQNEVVVTGSSLATEQRKSSTPIVSIPMSTLRENAFGNIINALTVVPGVNEISTGPAISKPIIRGLGANRILVISDNVRQEGQQWGDEHGVEIDDYNVSKVEVLKGPASLAYGSDALAGVINIVPDEILHNSKPISGVANLNYQTNNGLAAANLQLKGENHGFFWQTYGTLKAAHDYKNRYDGYVFNSRYQNADVGAELGLSGKWGYSRLAFSSFNQVLGVPEGERDSATGAFVQQVAMGNVATTEIVSDADKRSYQPQTAFQRIGHQKIAWNNSLFFNNGNRLGLTIGYQFNNRREFSDVFTPDVPELNLKLSTWSYDAKMIFSEKRGWKPSVGINGMMQQNTNAGTRYLIPDYTLFDGGIYGIVQKNWGKWNISGGLRGDVRWLNTHALYLDSLSQQIPQPLSAEEVKFSGFHRSFNSFSGSIGASYLSSPHTTFKFNLATGFRSPNIAELSANGVHEGTLRYEYGNAQLKPERSYQADLGAEYRSSHWYITISGFANFLNHYIYLQKLKTSSGNDSIPVFNNDGNYMAYTYTQVPALLFGGELYSDLHPHPLDWLHFDNTFSFVRGIALLNQTDSTKNLPQMPQPRWRTELRVQAKSLFKSVQNIYLKMGLDFNFEQNKIFSAYGTETSSPAYTLLNAGCGFDLNYQGRKYLTCSIAAQNLLNTPYQNHLSRLRFADTNNLTGRMGIWNQGRNISLLIQVPF